MGRGQYQLYIAAKEGPVLLNRAPDLFDCELGSERRRWTKLEECNFFFMLSAQCCPVWLAASFNEIRDNSLQTAGRGPAGVHVQYIIGFALLPRSSVYVPPVSSKHLKHGKQIYQFHPYTVDMQSQLLIVTLPQFWGIAPGDTRMCTSTVAAQRR